MGGRVKTGPYEGDWVSQWGNYTFTQAGNTITFLFQQPVKVADGKVVRTIILYDRLGVAQKLSYTITPPEVAKK